MPTTRRRRANPPEQPEQAVSPIETIEQANVSSETPVKESKKDETAADQTASTEAVSSDVAASSAEKSATPEGEQAVQERSLAEEKTQKEESSAAPVTNYRHTTHTRTGHTNHAHSTFTALPPATPVLPVDGSESYTNGSNVPPVRQERSRSERSDYAPTTIESGRRTARGELFRRPPQPPASPTPPTNQQSQLQPPSHEISLPLGNLLHLAYNPGYTGSEEARSILLQQLASESKSGGRARCWNCGALAIAYDRWQTKSKSFGEIGFAFCEICGVWSVM